MIYNFRQINYFIGGSCVFKQKCTVHEFRLAIKTKLSLFNFC